MNFVLDLILIFIIALSVVLSAKKGFVGSLIDIIGFVGVIIVAFLLSKPISSLITAYSNSFSPLLSKVVSIAVTILLSALLLFILKIILKIFNSVFKFSVLGKINTVLGGVLGLLKGLIISVLFCFIVGLICFFSGGEFLIFTKEAISNSFIFKFFMELSPFI